ncbi:MAG: NAD/NADP octopine/nopaline dehydrogenase family protein [Candidatus Lokiarchaeota archaeon]
MFIGETQTLLFTARALNKNKVQILKIKNSLNFTAFPENHTFFIYDTLKDVFPQLNAKKDYLQETLHNIGMLLHPTITLFNTGCLDNGKMFKYYKEGATRQICKVIEQLQFEINMIFQYLSIEPINFCQWAQQSYGVKGNNIYHTIQRIESYSEISSPQSLITRYFTEDIPTGLVPISSLAKSLDIETPTIDSIIQLSSVICNRNFFKEGRTIDKLNLNMFIQKRLKEIYPNIYSQYKILDKNKVI